MPIDNLAVSNNEPAELFDARSRIARLEAKVEQADFLLANALDGAIDYEDMVRKLKMAQQTLKEALSKESQLARA